MKENDYFLNQMYNTEFSPGDFATVGLNSSNTTIQDKEIYKDLDIVKTNPLFQTNGEFDNTKFDQLYNKAMFGFKQMSETDSNEKLASSYASFRDDIFSSNSHKKNQGAETYITKIANPKRQTLGFVSSNIMEAPTMSVREIAQSQMVWDGEKWTDSPNETSLDNFFNPKVLAQWDFDADENGNPTNDQSKIVYHKGDKKINPLTGTYYYETLNGRSIYGRDVLSGWDTLTIDGSPINKYDFFDSDDIEKSFTGSLLKSAVKIAPALIPGISPWYIGARMALSFSDLAGKIMKATTGSDNSIASWLEGFNAAWTESTSDQARGSEEYGIEGHPWSLENLLNLGSDVFTQLAEQRWIFKYGAALKSGKLGYSEKAQRAFKDAKTKEWLTKFAEEGKLADGETVIDLHLAAAAEAQAMLETKVKSAQKLSEQLSKLYMTGIVAADSYAEAKEAGLNDVEASIFTLAYALGEYGILNTGLGEHILPELRAERRRTENMLKALAQAPERTSTDTRKWYKKILDSAKSAISRDSNDAAVAASLKAGNTTKAMAQIVGVNAFGEGLEEVSEEFWLDIAKSLYNGASALGLTATDRTMEAFDGGDLSKVISRYALNFTGGLIGGGVAVGLPGFSAGIKDMLGSNMSRHQAYQELVAQIRNGQKNELLKTIDKLEIADSNIAASKEGQGTESDNMDKANKDLLKGMINMVDNLLNVNGVSIDDASILKKLSEPALQFVKFQTLLGNQEREGSTILASYVQRFNSLATEMADISAKIKAIEEKDGDQSPKLTSEQETELANLKSDLAEFQKQRDMYLNGEMSKRIFPKVLFELSAHISTPYIAPNFKEYVQKVEHRVLSEIPEARLKELKKEWEYYKAGGTYADDFQQVYGYFDDINNRFSDRLKQFDLKFFKSPQDLQQNIGNIFLGAETELNQLENPQDVQQGATDYFQTHTIAKLPRNQRNILALSRLIELLPNQFYKDEISILAKIPDTIEALKESVGEEIFNTQYVPALQQTAKNYSINGGTFDPNAEDADSQMVKIRDRAIRELAVDVLTNPNNVDNIKQILNDISYMNQSVKDFLLMPGGFLSEFINFTGDNQSRYDLFDEDDEDSPEYKEHKPKLDLLREYGDIIRSKQNSPIEELADQFQLTIGDNSMPISEIIRTLDARIKNLANKRKIEQFGYEEYIQSQIKHAQQVIQLLSSHILAARKDGARLGNLFGFNSTLNKLNPDSDLVEIDKEIADTLMMDLAKLNSKLETFANIFNINSGQKLVEQKQIKSRIDFNFIQKVKTLVAILPDDWVGKEELKAAIENSTVFNEMAAKTGETKYELDGSKRSTLQKESIQVQDAIYEFFAKNPTKSLDSILDKLVLLPSSTEESKAADGTIIDNKLNDFDDRSFVYMLATAAAVRASDFYELFKQSIDPKYAPIPGQELAVKMAFSFLMNQPLFEKFGKAYNDKLLKELNNVDSQFYREHYGKYISKDSKLDNSYALQFFHTFLVEGIPGAGKSTGFYKVLVNMLKIFKPELLKNVWIVHTDESKAEALGKELELENVKGFSKESYLKHVSEGYTPSIYKNGVIQENRDNLVENAETGLNSFKDVHIKQDIDSPTLIIFDESTRFSQQEMLLTEDFQSDYGIHGIATGDYDQIGAVGQIDLGENVKLYLNTSQDNFFHSPKLGTSMRTENKIKDENIYKFRSEKARVIKELRAGNLSEKINLKYFQNDTGIYGEKIVDEVTDEDLSLMLNTLKDGEKIVLISDNTESPLYKKLQELNEKNETFKGKIQFQSSGASQGSESQYYIVDLSLVDISAASGANEGNHENFVNTFYTTISRSKQGTLILKNRNIQMVASNTQASELVQSPLSQQAISDYGTEFVESLSDISGDTNNIEYISIQKSKHVKKKTTEKEDPEGEEGNEAPTDEEAQFANRRKFPIRNDNKKEYNMFLHSMPVSETGFAKNDKGQFVVSNQAAYEHRIDGLNGITKLPNLTIEKDGKQIAITQLPKTLGLNSDGTLINQKEALERLNRITQAGLYLDDKEKIKEIVIDTLGLNLSPEEIGIDFIFQIKSTDDNFVEKKGKFNRMFKSLAEKLIGVFRGRSTTEPVEQARQNKYFSLNIYQVVKDEKNVERRKNFLTVPLTIFTSPLTMMESEDFKDLKDVFVNKANKKQEKMIYLLQNDEDVKKLPNSEKLLKSFLIYSYKSSDGDVVVYMPEEFTLAGNAKAISGPNITVCDTRGSRYFYSDEYTYDGEYVELKDIDQSVHHLSKDIYYTPEDVVNEAGEVVIKKGHRFVLVSDYGKYRNDEEMLKAFNDAELSGKPKGFISVIYVSGPKISIEDFFRNFALKYKRASKEEATIDTSIGNEFTEFRIAEFITKQNSPFDTYIKDLVKQNKTEEVTSFLARWEIFKNIITEISKDMESMTPEQRVNLLKKTTKFVTSKYYDLIAVDDSAPQRVKNLIKAFKEGYRKDQSIKNFISNQLAYFVLKNQNGLVDNIKWGDDGKLDISGYTSDNIKKVIESLPKQWQEGVFTQLESKGEGNEITVEDNTFIPIKSTNYISDTESIKEGNRAIRINGKIDTTVFVMDVNPIMDTILDTINNPAKKAYQLDWYVQDSRRHQKSSKNPQKIIIPDGLKERFDGENIENIINMYESEFKDKDIENGIVLLEILNKVGYGIQLNNSSKPSIVKIPKNSIQIPGFNIIKTPSGEFTTIKGEKIILPIFLEELQRLTPEFTDINQFDEAISELEKTKNIPPKFLSLLKELNEYVKEQQKGDKDLIGLENILDYFNTTFIQDPDLSLILENNEIDTRDWIVTIEDYIMRKAKDPDYQEDGMLQKLLGLNTSILTTIGQNSDDEIREKIQQLNKTLEQIDNLADNYDDNNSCRLKI